MKYFYSLLIFAFTISTVCAQSNFNEPPTRSEFEQLKSKVQVYERNQNNVMARINGINTEIDDAFLRLDSVMHDQEAYLDSIFNRMALESQGLQEEAVKNFLTVDDLLPFESKMEENFAKQEEESMFYNSIAGGGILLVLITTLVLFFISNGKRKKLKKALLDLQESNKADIEKSIQEIKQKFESQIKENTISLQKENDKQVSALRTNISQTTQQFEEQSAKNMENVIGKLDDAIGKLNTEWKANLDALSKTKDSLIEHSEKQQSEKIADLVDSTNKTMKKLENSIKKLQTEIKKIDKKDS